MAPATPSSARPGFEETLAVVGIALVALAFSVYVVYVLEIVKLNNPRRFRRNEQPESERRSA